MKTSSLCSGRPAWLKATVLTTIASSALALGGCGISTLTSGLGGGMFGSGNSQAPAAAKGSLSEDQMINAAKLNVASTGGDVAGGCPRFVPWPRDETVTVYEPGRVGDGLFVMHRGEITKTARECSVDGDRVTVKYGFAGRVLMGPKGRTGNVTLPVTVFVTDSKRAQLTAEKLRVDTSISADKPIGFFSAVRTVSFQVPEGARPGEFEIFVGFERGIPNSG